MGIFLKKMPMSVFGRLCGYPENALGQRNHQRLDDRRRRNCRQFHVDVAAVSHLGEDAIDGVFRPGGVDVQHAHGAYHRGRQQETVLYFESGQIHQFRSHLRPNSRWKCVCLRARLVSVSSVRAGLAILRCCARYTGMRRAEERRKSCYCPLIVSIRFLAHFS